MKLLHRREMVLAGVAIAAFSLSGLMAAPPQVAAAATSDDPGFTLADVGPFGGEPSLVSDNKGVLYDSTPSGGVLVYKSTTHGKTWTQTTTPDPNSGDTCLATDQSNALYACNLAGSEGSLPLQADVWKSTDHGTTWTHGTSAVPQCGSTSCNPLGVDRQWTDASTPRAARPGTPRSCSCTTTSTGPARSG